MEVDTVPARSLQTVEEGAQDAQVVASVATLVTVCKCW